MNEIQVTMSKPLSEWHMKIQSAQDKLGYNDLQISELLLKMIGSGKVRSIATTYGFARRGVRTFTRKQIPHLAKILSVRTEVFEMANTSINGTVKLEFNSDIDILEFIKDIPKEFSKIGPFLIWLHTENERRTLMSSM